MNDEGYRTRAGKEWTSTAVYKILTNPWYIGQYVYNVHSGGKGADKRSEEEWITVENHHEPLYEETRFYRIKFLLQRNRRGGVAAGKTYVRKNIHVFGGLLRCSMCGSNMNANLDRRRANGIRPSIYACGSRRRKQTSCTNKYISDMVLGPFVLNYVANIIRAARSYNGPSNTELLSKKLLRGEVFANVEGVDEQALSDTLKAFELAGGASEYRPQLALSTINETITEADTLKSRKRRIENALSRLNALYLYDDDAMPEKDFVIQRRELSSQLNEVNARLEELQAQDVGPTYITDDFNSKGSYYIMFERLVQDSYIDYEKYIRSVDPSVPRSFLLSIIDHIDAGDGRVDSITFKNGITHHFTYKD